MESIRQLFIQLPSVLTQIKKVITRRRCARSGNLLGEFFYDLPEVVPHVDPHFIGTWIVKRHPQVIVHGSESLRIADDKDLLTNNKGQKKAGAYVHR